MGAGLHKSNYGSQRFCTFAPYLDSRARKHYMVARLALTMSRTTSDTQRYNIKFIFLCAYIQN